MFGKASPAVSLAVWQISNLKKSASSQTRKRLSATKPSAANCAHVSRYALETAGTPESPEALRLAVKRLDKAAAKRTIHPKQAARRKSRLMRKINAASAK